MPSLGITMNSEELNDLITQGGLFQDPNIDQQFQLGQTNNLINMQPQSHQAPPVVQPTLNTANQPYVDIVEQPKQRGLRFRYKCEGRSAGSIPGENSSNEQRTYPTIKIHNYDGQSAIVVVSCVTIEDPPRPHPHSLVGKDCNKGVCTVKLKNSSHTVSFPNLGIQCATRKAVKEALESREKIRVDPFATGYYKDINKIDLNIARLCFQVFLPDEHNKFTRIVQPVVSQAIYDKKAVNDLIICRLSRQSGHAHGGDEVFLLCEKVNKDDIQVRFYEDSAEGTVWEAYGEFAPNDVHRQFAIVCKTPPYKDQVISGPVSVFVQLIRPSDEGVSDPKPFQYIPDDPDPDGIYSKRRKKANTLDLFSESLAVNVLPPVKEEGRLQSPQGIDLKKRIIAKATRSNKKGQAPAAQGMPPQYSYNNIVASQGMPISTIANAPQQQQPVIVQQNQMTLGYQPSQQQVTTIAPGQMSAAGFQQQPGVGQPNAAEGQALPQRIEYVNSQEEINNTNSDQILQFLTDYQGGQGPELAPNNIADLTNYLQMPNDGGQGAS